ncbi:MAG: triose-phosphate isomerase [Candidatus Aenigmatarchaeota archaeon]
MLIINLKAYKETIGKGALKALEAAEKVAEEYNVEIAIAPQPTDIRLLSENSKRVKIFAQHIDPIKGGAYTGHILPEAVKDSGAVGTLINHSERQLTLVEIGELIEICKDLGLISVVCVTNDKLARTIAYLDPDYIAIEPPELIGTGISVSKAKPEIIINSVKSIREINNKVKILVGAGISNGEDVKKAIELGVNGVLVSSAITKSKDFYEKIKELINGFF